MAGAHAHTVSAPSLVRSGNVLLGNHGGSGLSQPILSSLAARRSQFGGVNMLAGYPSNGLLNGVSNAGLTGIAQSLGGSVGVSSLVTGSNSELLDLQRGSLGASEGMAVSGLGGMGLPASPASITSTIGNSMANQQGSSGLARMEQQELLVHQQQARSGTPPLAATTALSQLSQSMQSMQQERGVQGSQHGGGGQQSGGFPGQVGGSGSQVVSGGGSQQSMVLGGGVGHGSSMQGKAGGVASQQGVSGVKADAQYSGHSLQNQQGQQQLMRPKLEVETEMELDQKQAMQQLRSGNNVGGTAEMQLQEALQRQQSKQIQAHLSVLQQQRVLQGLSEQHVRDMTSIQLQQLQQQQVQMQQQQANLCSHQDNNIAFWRNFVGEYFAANARKRWCVSQYGSGGRQPTGIFPQDVWHCEICGTNPGRGFETTVEVLPRLMKMKFDSGIQEELLFVDVPHEYRQASGHMVLKYGKAIQESVFEQLRVVREGQLRIVFSAEWKILSWEFCGRSHEELLPRRLIVPQVNQLVQISQKYQSSQNGGAGASGQEMQTSCHLFVTSARQLAKNLELPTVNDLGYTKRYVRCLQISEVVNSMKDLIDHSRDNGYGPMG
uniref:Transcriptional corepressor SEUSS n=1 Tax=Physcomitrium patens TaxID=3218 RepID=A0A7I4D1E1_PHYPA